MSSNLTLQTAYQLNKLQYKIPALGFGVYQVRFHLYSVTKAGH